MIRCKSDPKRYNTRRRSDRRHSFRSYRTLPRSRQAGTRSPRNESLFDRLSQEGLVSLPQAYRKLGVGNISPSAMLRHANHGVRAASGKLVRLESVRIGSRRLTSTQAVRRFIEAQNSACDDEHMPPPTVREAREADDDYLDSLGLGRDED